MPVRLFVSDSEGPNDYVCFFEDAGDTGDLYISDKKKEEVIAHLQVYVEPGPLTISEDDVHVLWSKDQSKCGVLIRGKMRGILDLTSGKGVLPIGNEEAITDKHWLALFEGSF